MATLTGRTIANSYTTLLKVNTSTGLDSTLRAIEDGSGVDSALQLSTNTVNVDGTLQIGGVPLTATVSALNAISDLTAATGIIAVSAGTVYGRTLTGGSGVSITNGDGTEGNPTVALNETGVSAATYVGIHNITVNAVGQMTSIAPATSVSIAQFNSANVSIENLNITDNVSVTGRVNVIGDVDATNITVGTLLTSTSISATKIDAAIVSVDNLIANNLTYVGLVTSITDFTTNTLSVITKASVAALEISGVVSGTSGSFSGIVSATNINAAVSVGTVNTSVGTVNTAAVTSINTVTGINTSVGAVNTTAITSVNTVINAVSVLTSVNTAAVTSINSVISTVSAALATSIGNSNTAIAAVSVLTSANLEATTSITSRITTVSATLATSIGNSNTAIAAVSVLTSVNTAAVTSINSVIATVSSTLATSIGNSNTVIAAVSALSAVNLAAVTSINAVIATVSSTLATSIGTSNTLIAATSVALATSIANHLPLAGGTITGEARFSKSAYADQTSLTDEATVSISLDLSNNFHLTLGDNRTLGNPTAGNINLGQTGSIFVAQDGTGSRTLAFGTSYEFPAGTVPTMSTSINAVDRLDYIVRTSTAIQMVHSGEYS